MGSLYSKGETNMVISRYARDVYKLVKQDCEGMDAIYGDYLESIVGKFGLLTLLDYGLLESCGVVNGRQLYTLVELK